VEGRQLANRATFAWGFFSNPFFLASSLYHKPGQKSIPSTASGPTHAQRAYSTAEGGKINNLAMPAACNMRICHFLHAQGRFKAPSPVPR